MYGCKLLEMNRIQLKKSKSLELGYAIVEHILSHSNKFIIL